MQKKAGVPGLLSPGAPGFSVFAWIQVVPISL